jgi:kinesin family protein 11
MASSSSVMVAVRLRPMNKKEETQGTLPVVHASSVDNTITSIRGKGKNQQRTSFSYDNVFSSYSTQEQVFDATLRPVLTDVLNGYESTVFAYGQTGEMNSLNSYVIVSLQPFL